MGRLVFMLLAIAAFAPARAHGVADNHLVVVVSDTRISMSIVVDEQVLEPADVNRNGVVTLSELQHHHAGIDRWFTSAVEIDTGPSDKPSLAFSDLTTDLDHADQHGFVDHARVRRIWEIDPETVKIDFGFDALASRIADLRVTVVNDLSGERARLAPSNLTYTFERRPTP